MDLFGKDKELVLKLINAVLIIWFIAAIIISFNLLLNITVRERPMDFAEYRQTFCDGRKFEAMEPNCDSMYRTHRRDRDNNRQYEIKSFAVGLFNVVIVGATIYVLNRKKNKK